MFTGIVVKPLEADNVEVTGNCVITGEPIKIRTTQTCLDNYYKKGMKAQDAFPNLSADDREFFISGIGPKGWEQVT